MGWAERQSFNLHRRIGLLTSLIEEISEIGQPAIQRSAASRENQSLK